MIYSSETVVFPPDELSYITLSLKSLDQMHYDIWECSLWTRWTFRQKADLALLYAEGTQETL